MEVNQKGVYNLVPFIFLLLFLVLLLQFIGNLLRTLCELNQQKLKAIQQKKKHKFNRRKYEKPVQHLQFITNDQSSLGFTNQILYQQSKKSITFYVPTYVTCKIKSIQDVKVQQLYGRVSCAMIFNIYYGDIPQEIVEELQKSIILQLNRGQTIKLKENLLIKCTNNDQKKFLIFTVRKSFMASLKIGTLWDPFQIIELIITITLNTVSISPKTLKRKNKNSSYNEQKEYKVSFNCMRNSYKTPISYALDCVFGIYDLAQKRLQSYSSKESSYIQIIHNFQAYQKRQKKQQPINSNNSVIANEVSEPLSKIERSLENYMGMDRHTKKQRVKLQYYQYNHFIIPLYRYPGDAIASIFIPLFLLALVSLSIFFQEPCLSERVGTIATMVLGYIALIPSIRSKYPQITIIQSIVYIQTMCCLLCLYESFKIYYEQSQSGVQYKFIWNQNFTYMICLCTHISTFLFVSCLYIIHKLVWEPSYNSNQKVVEQDPIDNINKWVNPYCDQTFLKYNNTFSEQQKQLKIKPYKKQQQQKKNQIEIRPKDAKNNKKKR